MIVGAGTAGLYLAGKTGMTVWEKQDKIREKACGGLFSKNVEKHVELDECVLNKVNTAILRAGREELVISRKEAQAFVVDRFLFQEKLLETSRNKGAKVVFGKQWKGEEEDFVIGADGALSSVANNIGVKHNFIFTYQEEVLLREKTDTSTVHLYFGEFAPGFFAWLIPLNDETVRIGLGVRKGNPKQYYDSFIQNTSIGIREVLKKQSALIPLFNPKHRIMKGNKALVGDAAGQVKAFSGGGVVFGLRSADLLAKAMEKQDLEYYEEKYEEKVKPELANHLLLYKLFQVFKPEKLLRAANEGGLKELIEQAGDMEDLSALKKQALRTMLKPKIMIKTLKAFL